MSRDYARQDNAPKKPKRKAANSKAKTALPGWLWAVCGLTAGLCIAAIIFIVLRPVEKTSIALEAAPNSEKIQSQDNKPKIPARQEAKFKFYDLLPKYEIKPNEEAYKVAPPPERAATAAASNATYVIQAGSFLAPEDAERRKATIALIGIESTVSKVTVDGKGTRYRVQIGPSKDYQQVQKTMRQLADSDIDSFASRTDG